MDSASVSQFCCSVCQEKWLPKFLVLQSDTQADLWSLGRLGGEGPSVHPPVTFSISSPLRRRFWASKKSVKSVWKDGLSIKISLHYASIASEIPLSITSKSQSVAWHTVIIFF